MELLYEEAENAQDARKLFRLLQETALFLWKDWPRDMEAVALNSQDSFSLTGTCPHCNRAAVFIVVSGKASEIVQQTPQGQLQRLLGCFQCQGCKKYILAQVFHLSGQMHYTYETHYPLGKPDDDVAGEIPDHIKPDFKEALRCLWVDAYNATAEMCRRAIEASCLDLGAPPKDVLEDMIDWLSDQRVITPFLQKAAHKIRLGGNRGAHPTPAVVTAIAATAAPTVPATSSASPAPSQVITKIEKEHAEAIVEFTRHFFQHVYVGPKQLAKYDFSKPKASKP